MRLTVILFGVMLLAMPSHAQDELDNSDSRCWYASKAFSAGTMIRLGDAFFACTVSGTWSETTGPSANCLFQDQIYGVGSLVAVDNVLLECRYDGAWTRTTR